MRAGSADRDEVDASRSEACKRSPHARPTQISVDECSYKLASLSVDSVGRLGEEGSNLMNQVVASIIAGTDGSSLAKKGVYKERIF